MRVAVPVVHEHQVVAFVARAQEVERVALDEPPVGGKGFGRGKFWVYLVHGRQIPLGQLRRPQQGKGAPGVTHAEFQKAVALDGRREREQRQELAVCILYWVTRAREEGE